MIHEMYTAVPATNQVESVLQDLNIDPQVIEQITMLLDTARDDLAGDKELLRVPVGAFGPSSSGSYMAVHTDSAAAHVVQALADMMAGLEEKREAVRMLVIDGTETDLSIADQLSYQKSLQDAVSCVAKPDVRENPACVLPTDDVSPLGSF